MSEKSNALRLADAIDPKDEGIKTVLTIDLTHAAAELRRLHEVNTELVAALGEIEWSNNSKWQQDRARAAIAKATGEQQ